MLFKFLSSRSLYKSRIIFAASVPAPVFFGCSAPAPKVQKHAAPAPQLGYFFYVIFTFHFYSFFFTLFSF